VQTETNALANNKLEHGRPGVTRAHRPICHFPPDGKDCCAPGVHAFYRLKTYSLAAGTQCRQLPATAFDQLTCV
jgi:hypothetical protein